MDEVGWQALALALTIAGGGWTWYAARNRGTVSALRGAGVTLLVPAAYLTGTLEMGGEVVSAVADWATGFVFSPMVWVGLALAGLGVLLLVVAGWMAGRDGAAPEVDRRRTDRLPRSSREPQAEGRGGGKGAPAIDDDLADIEALLRKRGIT